MACVILCIIPYSLWVVNLSASVTTDFSSNNLETAEARPHHFLNF